MLDTTDMTDMLKKLACLYHSHILLMCGSDSEIEEAEKVWIENIESVGLDVNNMTIRGDDD